MSNVVAEEEKVKETYNELLSEVLTNLISPSILINNASIHCAHLGKIPIKSHCFVWRAPLNASNMSATLLYENMIMATNRLVIL